MRALTGLLFLIACTAQADAVRLSEPVASDAVSETFGQAGLIGDDAAALRLPVLLNDPAKHLQQPITLHTNIARVSQKKGCFFIAQEGAHAIRVSFRDYGFFIPTDSSGKPVEMVGELVEVTLSPEQARHYQADLGEKKGEEAEIGAGKRFEFIADAVRVPRVLGSVE